MSYTMANKSIPGSGGNFTVLMDTSGNWSNMTFNPDDFKSPFSVLFYRYMFIVIYSVIFATCLIGNTLVLVVTIKSARMKTRTNFFLANLAAADLCVGILCVLPNLLTYLYPGWLLGTAMCKIYYFSESFSFCTSVLLLAVIALERYIAVMHPLRAKGMFTRWRMHTAQTLIWIFAAIYNIPLMIIFDTVPLPNGLVFCFYREIINLRLYYTINFILWYVFPLVTMSVVYAIISWTLWNSVSIFKANSHNNVSNESVTKMTPVVPDHRSSSSSSGAGGSGSCRSADSGSHRGSSCSSGRHSNSCAFDGKNGYHCSCGYCAEVSDRFLLNGEETCGRCGGDTTLSYNGGPKNSGMGPVQLAVRKNEDGVPVHWSWPTGQDSGRGDKSRQPRRSPYMHRQSAGTNNVNSFEMTCLNSTCLHYQRTHPKRANKPVQNFTVAVTTKSRRSSNRSYHSEYASEVSSPGKGGVTRESSGSRSYQHTSMRVLSSRRKVVRLLVLVLLTFALCVLPHHVRLLMQHWEVYPGSSFSLSFFPPLAFICMYLNSALNPILYSLFSESFRHSLRECLRRPGQRCMSFRPGRKFSRMWRR